MLNFVQQKSFTLRDIFQSVYDTALEALNEFPPNERGRMPKYLDITQRMHETLDPEKVSPKEIGHLLDEFDDGLSNSNKHEHPYALPLITNQAENRFAEIMLNHFEQAYEHRKRLDLKEYAFWLRPIISFGLVFTMPKQEEVLRKRIDDFENQRTHLILHSFQRHHHDALANTQTSRHGGDQPRHKHAPRH